MNTLTISSCSFPFTIRVLEFNFILTYNRTSSLLRINPSNDNPSGIINDNICDLVRFLSYIDFKVRLGEDSSSPCVTSSDLVM